MSDVTVICGWCHADLGTSSHGHDCAEKREAERRYKLGDVALERMRCLEDAVTAAEEDGDPIWKFYDAKTWRSLTAWKMQAEREAAEAEGLRARLAAATQALREIDSKPHRAVEVTNGYFRGSRSPYRVAAGDRETT